jgi:hypothetical protein
MQFCKKVNNMGEVHISDLTVTVCGHINFLLNCLGGFTASGGCSSKMGMRINVVIERSSIM